MDHDDGDPRGRWVWIAIGCGGLALSLLCVAPPVIWLLRSDPPEGADAPRAPIAPAPPTSPSPPVAPRPPVAPPAPPLAPLPPPPSPAITSPRRVTATVEAATGVPGLRAGSECSFDVTHGDRPDGTFWCNAQVRCAGRLLYGGPSAGFFECTLYERPERHVVGEDPSTTSQDGDAAMRLDTLAGRLTVRDDPRGRLGAFTVRARVTGVQ